MTTARALLFLPLAPTLLSLSGSGPEEASGTAVRYGRDVRPILSQHCFKCHGPDERAREAGLRLDHRDGATALRRSGRTAIVPGDAAASEVWERVTAADPYERMPPPETGKPGLDDAELEILRRWIEDGAPYEEHWAFVPPSRPTPPEVRDEGWVRNPIDRFVLKDLEAHGATPAPPASPTDLLRRTFLDVTGLSPTPAEALAFEQRVTYGQSVHSELDRTLERLFTESPYRERQAEHAARAWLDEARYADTSGIHTDAGRQAWLWRDWVLEALRDDMPFDRFVREQLAGDLLPDATLASRVATGFLRNHVTSDEGGAIDAEYRLEYAADRVNTVGSVFLGLSLGCARCHDHKYDPVSMEDYYSLIAYFDNNEEPGIYSQERDSQRAFEPNVAVPRPEQSARLAALADELEATRAEMEDWTPEEERAWADFQADTAGLVDWRPAHVEEARAEQGATLAPQTDGSVLASGPNPADDVYELVLRTDATDLSVLSLEALPADLAGGPIGRVAHANAVLRALDVEAVSVADPTRRAPVELAWAWADYAQTDQDFSVTNLITSEQDPEHPRWWALGGHQKKGARRALFLAQEPFGYEGGTRLVVRLDSRSLWPQHTLARPRVRVGALSEAARAKLPVALGRTYQAGPFAADYEGVLPPERAAGIARGVAQAGDEGREPWSWRFDARFLDGVVVDVPSGGRDANVLARPLFVPTARELDLSLGSDDGFALFLDGERVAENRTDRAPAPDQDRVTLSLTPGRHLLALRVVNSGGPAGAYFRFEERAGVLSDAPFELVFPGAGEDPAVVANARNAWRRARSPRYAELEARIAALQMERAAVEREIPRAMVMRERAERRPTYVHRRGLYDQPDVDRPVQPDVPHALGTLADDEPRDRRALADWLLSPANPLTARVVVNRLWARVFGRGLVATVDDFGLQGDWPTHPELLDWLAVEFRESGWDVQHMLRLMLESATYRQDSSQRADLAGLDADRLLARGPHKRLSGEAVRDNALWAAGLLVERFGGPSVKPYQPEGLWREVAMPASNTSRFQRGSGDDLWRRSLYTYWKRAAPPPSMMAFDAPTREFCVVERATTDTPLQALVLWNDEQFVEAARALAVRVMREAEGDGPRVRELVLRVLGRQPEGEELARLEEGLADLRERFAGRADDARALLGVGEVAAPEDVAPEELAVWTLVASAVLNLYETTNPR